MSSTLIGMTSATPLNTLSDLAEALPGHTAGRIGLVNLGNTCYMNSVMQCLAHLPEFTTYIRSQQYVKDMEITIKRYLREKNLAITEESMNAIRDRSTSYRLFMTISCMWQNGGRIRPRTLHETLCREQTELSARTPDLQLKLSQFNKFCKFRQEDSHEMFMHILDRVHCELTVCKRVVYNNPEPGMLAAKRRHDEYLALIADPASTEEIKAVATEDLNQYRRINSSDYLTYQACEFWKKHIAFYGHSTVSDLFDTIFNTRVNCMTCHTVSNTFSALRALPIELTTDKDGKCKLEDCIDTHMRAELLHGSESYKCELCDRKLPAVKAYRIWEPAKYFVIQLKRFKTTNGGSVLHRINNPVSYPHVLDITKWIAKERNTPYSYNLVSVSLQHGSLEGGHYTAYAKCGDKWCHFDDAVTPAPIISPEQAVSADQSSYVLFYELNQ